MLGDRHQLIPTCVRAPANIDSFFVLNSLAVFAVTAAALVGGEPCEINRKDLRTGSNLQLPFDLFRRLGSRAGSMGGSLRPADRPSGAAVSGAGCRPNCRRSKTSYGQIEDSLLKNKTVGEVYRGFGASFAGSLDPKLASRPHGLPCRMY